MARAVVKVTTNHNEILRWAEERGARPARVKGTGGNGDVGILRLEFPGAPGARDENLEPISWDDWLREFDQKQLALIYEEKTASGRKSNFNKIVSRETAEAELQRIRKTRGTTRSRTAARGSRSAASRSATATSRRRTSGGATRRATARKPSRKAARKSASSRTSGTRARSTARKSVTASRRSGATTRGRRTTRAKSTRSTARKSTTRATSRSRSAQSRKSAASRRSGRVIVMKRRSGRGGSRRAA